MAIERFGVLDGVCYCADCERYSWGKDWLYVDERTASTHAQCPCCGTWRNATGIYSAPYVWEPHPSGPLRTDEERNKAAEARRRVSS